MRPRHARAQQRKNGGGYDGNGTSASSKNVGDDPGSRRTGAGFGKSGGGVGIGGDCGSHGGSRAGGPGGCDRGGIGAGAGGSLGERRTARQTLNCADRERASTPHQRRWAQRASTRCQPAGPGRWRGASAVAALSRTGPHCFRVSAHRLRCTVRDGGGRFPSDAEAASRLLSTRGAVSRSSSAPCGAATPRADIIGGGPSCLQAPWVGPARMDRRAVGIDAPLPPGQMPEARMLGAYRCDHRQRSWRRSIAPAAIAPGAAA